MYDKMLNSQGETTQAGGIRRFLFLEHSFVGNIFAERVQATM